MGLLRGLRNAFFTGLAILLPVVITVSVLVWVVGILDRLTGALVVLVTGERVPGLGALLAVALLVVVGFVGRSWLGGRLVRFLEQLVLRIPVVRSIFGPTKQLVEVFMGQREGFSRVVLLEYPRAGAYTLGFLTREPASAADGYVSVFVPTTPNPTSGFVVLLPRGEVTPVPVTMEEGMRAIVSGGILLPPAVEELLSRRKGGAGFREPPDGDGNPR